MFILNCFPIVKRAERPEKGRDTVRSARLIKSRVKLVPSTLRRRWKLHLTPGIDSSQSANRRTQRTKQRCRERLQHQFKKPNRCRNRTLGRSKNIPDISRSLWRAYHHIASQRRRTAPRIQSSRSEYAR